VVYVRNVHDMPHLVFAELIALDRHRWKMGPGAGENKSAPRPTNVLTCTSFLFACKG
jgi:hypothetical protein